MFIPNIGQTVGLLLGAVVIVAPPPVQAADNYILGRCKVSELGSGAEILPTFHGDDYLYKYHRGDPRYQGFTFDDESAKVTLVKAPAHGKVERVKSDVSNNYYHYMPNEGYSGQDRFVMQVEKNGVKVQIQYLIEVPAEGESTDGYCNRDIWKISATTPALDNARLQALLGAANIDNNVSVTFADLAGGAIGQAAGNTITLDTNAAGNGWFIDTTPGQNEEWLPTSNPNEWVAKEGSDAYGKMDMLSVLLHEYGHALGIDHSADSHDYMATTLTPGVRRMPSAEELALMQRLVGQVKEGMVADSTLSPSPSPASGRGWPAGSGEGDNNAPNPALPLSGGFLAFLGRRREGISTAVRAEPVEAQSARISTSSIRTDFVPQYAIAANAAFTGLDTPTGWNTLGSVGITNNAATLNEVSATHTRLSQVFTVNAKDRYLTFTLSGAALDDLTGAPDDAFEAALLDASTGASLLGGIGLTRSDAFFNLQADGAQHLANCVTCTDNPDGSRTYRVDLSGIAAGTVANLSFDLIGFGQNNSRLTLSDVRVSGLPQLQDEAATMLEDGSLAFDPYAQADAQLRPMLAANVVDAPLHGAITVNGDGTFSYTPDLDYFGADSFTYRLADGPLESNLATSTPYEWVAKE